MLVVIVYNIVKILRLLVVANICTLLFALNGLIVLPHIPVIIAYRLTWHHLFKYNTLCIS